MQELSIVKKKFIDYIDKIIEYKRMYNVLIKSATFILIICIGFALKRVKI